MSDPASGVAINLASGGVGSLLHRGWRALSFDWRAARWVVKRARARGLTVHLKPLKIMLADGSIRRALEAGDDVSLATVRDRLKDVPIRTSDGEDAGVDVLFSLVRLGYLGASELNEAVVTHHIQVISQLSSIEQAVADGASDAATFRFNLQKISPILGQDVARLREQQPAVIERLIAELVRAMDRSQLLSDWSTTRPDWLTRAAGIDGWLGEAAMDVDAKSTAVAWFDSAIAQGATPRGYWKVRRMWAAEIRDDEVALAYLADVSDYPLVQGIMQANSSTDRIGHLEAWHPSTSSQESLRATLLAQFARDEDRLDEAIRMGREAFETHNRVGAGLVAVECLIRRSAVADHRFHASDLSDALTLALRIRDARRRWGSSSGAAVAHAMRAYMLLMDPERAWALSQEEPDGEATAVEARHPDVRDASVILMAERGSVEMALDQLDDSFSEAAHLQVEAREAELLLDEERARELWSRAIASTDDWNDKASLCFRQATRGYLDPFVEELRVGNPEIAGELDLVAGLFAEAPGAEGRAQAAAVTNPRLAHALVMFFGQKSRHIDVISASERAAQTWGDADDWLRAAKSHQLLGHLREAIDRAGKALQAGGPRWGDQFAAYVVQTECAFQLDDWASAALSATSMLTLRPSSSSARWALVLIRYNAGDEDEAHRVWAAGNPGPKPSSEAEASVWLSLFRLHGSEMATLAELQQVATDFAGSEQIRNLAIGAVTMAPITEDSSSVNLATLFEQYENDFPEGNAFFRITVDTEDRDALIAQLDAAAGGPRDTTAIDTGLRNGTLPVGLAAQVAHRFYAEGLMLRRRAPRFAGPLAGVDELAAIAAAVGSTVVVDTTALLTMALLPEDAANLLAGRFVLRSTSQQLLDANASRESLSREAGGQFIPSSTERGAEFVPDDPVEREALRGISQTLVEWFRRTERVSNRHQDSELIVALGEAAGTWTSAADLAIKQGLAFWCDDAATRRIVSAAGVPTFGTPAVVEQARIAGIADGALADSIDAALIHRWSVGVVYRAPAYQLALDLDGGAAHGIAAAFRYGGPIDAPGKLSLMLSAMGRTSDRPEELQRWVYLATEYLSEVASDSDAAHSNRVILLRTLLAAPWMTAATLPFVIVAVKAAAPDTWREAFRAAFQLVFKTLVDDYGFDIAGSFGLSLIANLEEADRLVAVSVIIER